MKLRLGVLLQLASIVPWACVPLLPFLGFSAAVIGVGALVLGGIAEAMIWVGLFLMGREAYRAAKRQGWRQMPAELWRMLRTGRVTPEPIEASAEASR